MPRALATPRRKAPLVFLIDVDDTLLDNDRVGADLRRRLDRVVGAAACRQYFRLLAALRRKLGYVDYLGALQRLRERRPHRAGLLEASYYLLDYPFERRLYPGALRVLRKLRRLGPTVIVSDGDIVFQPHKIQRAGIRRAVQGRVLVYIHKELELADVARRHPARHYVLVDDKPRILEAVKKAWGDRVTTVWARQGHYARAVRGSVPAADATVARIGDLLRLGASVIDHRRAPKNKKPPRGGS